MTEIPLTYSGSGTEDDPITFDAMRTAAPDPLASSIAGLPRVAKTHAAAFTAALSGDLPADLRQIATGTSNAVTETLNTAHSARVKADSFRNDVALYPAGREALASEVLQTAVAKVDETLARVDDQIQVIEALAYEAARPRIAPDDSMPARADLAMMTQRAAGDVGTLLDTLARLAQRSDAVGALVADQRYLSDFLEGQGVERVIRESALSRLSAEVIKAAAASGDPKRAAAARTYLALPELRKARVAAATYARHTLQP
ncbi:hypothetical protein ACWCQZ_43915 [Streptomyces sp. NPDC002285]